MESSLYSAPPVMTSELYQHRYAADHSPSAESGNARLLTDAGKRWNELSSKLMGTTAVIQLLTADAIRIL